MIIFARQLPFIKTKFHIIVSLMGILNIKPGFRKMRRLTTTPTDEQYIPLSLCTQVETEIEKALTDFSADRETHKTERGSILGTITTYIRDQERVVVKTSYFPDGNRPNPNCCVDVEIESPNGLPERIKAASGYLH
jgi:hypothetical protein